MEPDPFIVVAALSNQQRSQLIEIKTVVKQVRKQRSKKKNHSVSQDMSWDLSMKQKISNLVTVLMYLD